MPTTAPQRSLPSDAAINAICVALSVAIFCCVPTTADVQKPQTNRSFWKMYWDNDLDVIPHDTQLMIAAFISTLFNAFVIYFHAATHQHPKFVMIRTRRIVMSIHITAGVTEMISWIGALFVGDPTVHYWIIRLMTVAAMVHAATAYFQTGMLFGAKGIMVPCYLYTITLHLCSAYQLLLNPTSAAYMMKTYIVVSVYVWCRVFYFVFRKLNMFPGCVYTISITLSCNLLFPFGVDPIGNFGFLAIVAVYDGLHWIMWNEPDLSFSGLMFIEHERYTLTDKKLVSSWNQRIAKKVPAAERDLQKAKAAFKNFDEDNSGHLSIAEVQAMVKYLQLDPETRKQVEKAIHAEGDQVSFDTFYKNVWSLTNVNGRLANLTKDINELPPREQAMQVFKTLDIDDSGFLDRVEIDVLLQVWGLPRSECEAFFNEYNIKSDKFDFEVFFTKMQPIWKFIVHEVVYDDQVLNLNQEA